MFSFLQMIFISIFLLSTAPAFSNWTFDRNMSSRDRKRAGITKLTPKQKRNLQAWVNENFEYLGKTSQKKESYPYVSEILQEGKYLKLSDNSIWEIQPNDRAIVQSWITPASIDVVVSKDATYPYLLKNQSTGTSIFAQKIAPLTQYDLQKTS